MASIQGIKLCPDLVQEKGQLFQAAIECGFDQQGTWGNPVRQQSPPPLQGEKGEAGYQQLLLGAVIVPLLGGSWQRFGGSLCRDQA